MKILSSTRSRQARTRPPFKLIGLGLSTSLAAFGLYVIDPARYTDSPARWLCPFHAATGLYCPVCGATRAAHYLLHGDLAAALHCNLLLVAAIPFLVWLLWDMARAFASHHSWPGLSLSARQVGWLVAVALVFGLLRNLPLSPFNWLAP